MIQIATIDERLIGLLQDTIGELMNTGCRGKELKPGELRTGAPAFTSC